MKTQISAHPSSPTQPYNGVYLQQGRMLLDADWNAQVEIQKQTSLQNNLLALGSGIPAADKGGTSLSYPQCKLKPGYYVAQGKIVQIEQETGLLSTLPSRTSTVNGILYIDTYDQEITALHDDSIRDPGLYGADTCTRTQAVTQLRWASNESALYPKGLSSCSITARSEVEHALFRIEIHGVDWSKKTITFKWSFENGAEQHPVDSVPTDFSAGQWVYEHFSNETETLKGLTQTNHNHLAVALSKDLSSNPQNLPFVRRWNGFAEVQWDNNNAPLVQYYDNTVELTEGLNQDTTGHIHYDGQKFTLHLGCLYIEIQTAHSALFIGDHWCTQLRAGITQINEILLEKSEPLGYKHHYLVLGTIRNRRFTPTYTQLPSLSSLTSKDVLDPETGTTVQAQIQTLQHQTQDHENRLDQCETDIDLIKQGSLNQEERLALWGKGIANGLVPQTVNIVTAARQSPFKVELKFLHETTDLIDGTGAFLRKLPVSSPSFSFDGVYHFKSTNYLSSMIHTVFTSQSVRFDSSINKVRLYDKSDLAIYMLLAEHSNIPLSTFMQGTGNYAFSPQSLITQETNEILQSPVYVTTSNGQVSFQPALFYSEKMTSEEIYQASVLISLQDKIKDYDSLQELKQSLSVENPDAVNIQSVSSTLSDWDVYYQMELQNKQGSQICMGTIISTRTAATLTTDQREQLQTSLYLRTLNDQKSQDCIWNSGSKNLRLTSVPADAEQKLNLTYAISQILHLDLSSTFAKVNQSMPQTLISDGDDTLVEIAETLQSLGANTSITYSGENGDPRVNFWRVEMLSTGSTNKVLPIVQNYYGNISSKLRNKITTNSQVILSPRTSQADAQDLQKKLEEAGATVRITQLRLSDLSS